jgi:DNA-binding NtrC family response regulator
MAKILVIDDEMGIRELLSEILDDEGHEILLAQNAAVARPLYTNHNLDLVLLDIWMPDTDGMSLLREWTIAAPLRCPVIMMSGHASIDTAVEAQSLGAVGFLEKPITMQKLLSDVHKALHRATLTPTPSAQAAVALETTLESNEGDQTSMHTQEASQAQNLSQWHAALSRANLDTGLREFREEVERIYFTYLIEREQCAMTRVAEQAGLERTHLYRKLKQLNIEINRKAKV